jgi:hypothetical protein
MTGIAVSAGVHRIEWGPDLLNSLAYNPQMSPKF